MEEEKEIKDQYGLDDEQIAWRRWCIRANCGGDVVKFRQEYPSTPNEAFVATGRPVFDTGCLECARKEAAKPKYEGRVYEINGRVEFQSGYNGYLKIWEMVGMELRILQDEGIRIPESIWSTWNLIKSVLELPETTEDLEEEGEFTPLLEESKYAAPE